MLSLPQSQFVSPVITKPLLALQLQLQSLKQKRNEITLNNKLNPKAKQKLLSYNDECIRDVLMLIDKGKSRLLQYMDKQVTVITKQQFTKGLNCHQNNMRLERQQQQDSRQIQVQQSNGCYKLLKNGSFEQLTKLTFDESYSYTNSSNLNKTGIITKYGNMRIQCSSSSPKFSNKSNCNEEYAKQKQDKHDQKNINNGKNKNSFNLDLINLDRSCLQTNQWKIQKNIGNLDTTGRLTNNSRSRSKSIKKYIQQNHDKINAVKSFQLVPTDKNQLFQPLTSKTVDKFHNYRRSNYQADTSTKFDNFQNRSQQFHCNSRGSISKIRLKQISHRFNIMMRKKQFQLQMQKLIHRDTQFQIQKLREEAKQDKMLIQLLRKKIQLLENNAKYNDNQKKSKSKTKLKMKSKQKQKHDHNKWADLLEQQRKKAKTIQEEYRKQLCELRQKYDELEKFRQQNKILMAKRKQIIKINQKN